MTNRIWRIRTGIRDTAEAAYRVCAAWIGKYPSIQKLFAIYAWVAFAFLLWGLIRYEDSRTMLVQYLWSFYVLLQFWFLCRSKTLPWKQVSLLALSGALVVVPFTALTLNAIHGLAGGRTRDVWSMAVATPIVEEAWKLLPLGAMLLFARRATAFSLGDYAIVGAASGVGFQLMEELTRRWINHGVIAKTYGYSYTMLGGETIHWDFFSLFPGRFEPSLFPTVMTVSHPVHTALVALGCGMAVRLRKRTNCASFAFPAILLGWAILDHAAYNGQDELPKWLMRFHAWTGSGYETRGFFLLLLAAALIWDYAALNRVRDRLPAYRFEPVLNPLSEWIGMAAAWAGRRGSFLQAMRFYRERRELGFAMLYGNAEAAGRIEPLKAKLDGRLAKLAAGAAALLLLAGVGAGWLAYVGQASHVLGDGACFACMFESLQRWWDRLGGHEQAAIVLGAFALAMLFVGFWPALGFAMTVASTAGSGREIADYIRHPRKLLTPENAIAVAIGIALSRIPFGRGLRWVAERGRGRFGHAIDKLGAKVRQWGERRAPKPPAEPPGRGPDNVATHAKHKELLRVTEAANPLVDSLRQTGRLPPHFVDKTTAAQHGYKPGKALNNYVPGGQIGGDVFQNTTKVLPESPGRVWYEADVGLTNTMSRAKQPGTRLLYSDDGLMYVTSDHYKTVNFIGRYK
ncbi:PrsW family glutamic-type intramembrane protease [Cohnella sp. REN36]|uniref:PrsW family glutamic-type intramembrane protease n=1 Tax=Cohnella sp. REN36 TaxID=2887347 RepID=UPI001D13C68C|nr:ribonuclease domain-containing protein [Cohnella sp. REN36]MCC3374417.1 PrsW family intramembrane metalloprotease [Cohnella sp. REN36]